MSREDVSPDGVPAGSVAAVSAPSSSSSSSTGCSDTSCSSGASSVPPCRCIVQSYIRKPVRCSVAAVVRRPEDGAFLAVRRPPDDDRLPDIWGFPAVTLAAGEMPEAGIRRVGKDKLAADIEPVRLIGVATADRGDYQLVLLDFEARLLGGEPNVRTAPGPGTRYVDQQWTDRLRLLDEGAARGSLCCQIFLDASRRRSDDSP